MYFKIKQMLRIYSWLSYFLPSNTSPCDKVLTISGLASLSLRPLHLKCWDIMHVHIWLMLYWGQNEEPLTH